MSPEVREVLGAQGIQRVREAALEQARCPVCSDHVPPAGPVNVVISSNGSASVITFCHPRCAPSALMGADFDLDELLPDVAGMRMTALLLAHGGAELPVLVAERPLHAWHDGGRGGELTDIVVSALLGHGFALVPRLRDAPRAMLPEPATLAYAKTGLSELLIETAPGELFYEGTANIAPGWRAAVERYGWCVLYAGSNLSDPVTEDITVPILKAAATAGTLTGTRMQITWTTTAPQR